MAVTMPTTNTMNAPVSKLVRCAIYARKSSEHNLDLAFTSLDAQREACEAYIKSQAAEGWRLHGTARKLVALARRICANK
jgi:hypothetical protein